MCDRKFILQKWMTVIIYNSTKYDTVILAIFYFILFCFAVIRGPHLLPPPPPLFLQGVLFCMILGWILFYFRKESKQTKILSTTFPEYFVVIATFFPDLTLTAPGGGGGGGGLGGSPRQILPRTQNRRAASWLFSLKSCGYFDTKFAKIGPPVTESRRPPHPPSPVFSWIKIAQYS